ncbi:hypothetical protein TNCV_3454841 [Trichonephila clavipes]|nr:hypothetical protein TNCV_3454841 [Trichonephila clavipes]
MQEHFDAQFYLTQVATFFHVTTRHDDRPDYSYTDQSTWFWNTCDSESAGHMRTPSDSEFILTTIPINTLIPAL